MACPGRSQVALLEGLQCLHHWAMAGWPPSSVPGHTSQHPSCPWLLCTLPTQVGGGTMWGHRKGQHPRKELLGQCLGKGVAFPQVV